MSLEEARAEMDLIAEQLEEEYPAFGVLPARVREPGRNAGVGGRKQRFRAALVIVEVAASLVLLVSSGS